MTPYTIDDAEADVRAALDRGDVEQITTLAAVLDELDQAAREARPTPSLLGSALWYAEQGLHVFPLTPGAKIPLPRSRGFKDATTDAEQIRAWWAQTPDANIGIATGHLVDVVDIDGAPGQASRAGHWPMFERLAVIGKVLTPRPGGMHLFVPATGEGNRAGILPGVDYRGVGGYVVAAPSRTDVGTYRWLAPLQLPAVAGVAA